MKQHPIRSYTRVSKLEQAKNSNALEQQQSRCLNAGATKNYSDVHSGTKDKRPEFQQMLTDAKCGSFKELIITRIDRLTRSLITLRKVVDVLQQCKVNLRVLDQDIDLNTASGRFFLNILGSAAEMESDMLSERSKHGWEYLRQMQIAVNPPFGYRLSKDKKLELDTDPFLQMPGGRELSRSDLAKEIIFTFNQVESLRGTARAINKKYGLQNLRFAAPKSGFVSKGRFHCSISGLGYWLENPALCGHYRYLEGTDEEMIISNTHPDHRLLTDSDQERIKRTIADNASRRGFAFIGTKYPMAGLVYCAECGATCYSNKAGSRNGSPRHYYYYRCSNSNTNACSQTKMTRMDTAEDAVVQALIEKRDAIASLAEAPDQNVEPTELRDMKARLAALESIPGFDPDIEEARVKLRLRIDNFLQNMNNQSLAQGTGRDTLQAIFAQPNYWYTLPDNEKQVIYRSLVKRVIVRDGQVQNVILRI